MDRALADWLPRVAPNKQWLLKQTLYTAPYRRAMLNALDIPSGSQVLDIGTGYGLMALEMALRFSAHVTGLDADPDALAVAESVYRSLSGFPVPVRFTRGDVYALPFPDASWDWVSSRFVFQHLAQPQLALSEIRRTLKPGGMCYLEDIDDGWTVQYPPPPPAWAKVLEAFRRLQALRGGDREIGRKLGLYLTQNGFAIVQQVIQPAAAVTTLSATDPAVLFELERVNNEKEALIAHALLTPADWDAGRDAFLSSLPQTLFVSNASVHILAQRARDDL